jgi:hypothetical protein
MTFEEMELNDELENRLRTYLYENGDTDFSELDDDFDSFDESVSNFDFSNVEGKDFKSAFVKVNRKISKVIAPSDRTVIVEGRSGELIKPKVRQTQRKIDYSRLGQQPKNTQKRLGTTSFQRPVKPFTPKNQIGVEKKATIFGKGRKLISKVIVPRDKEVIVEGVSKFILSTDKKNDRLRQIGYYQGEKLKEMVLIFNNDSAVDFVVDIFNMSMPLNYLYSNSQNLNNKIQVAGGNVQYSDLLFSLLANPTMIPNCKFTFSGANTTQQIAIPLEFKNQDVSGREKIHPLNLALKIDNLQVANDIVFFDMQESLNRPFIPNGMDFISYKVLAGMTVTMAFFYKQVDMKKVFYQEARKSKELL